MSALLPEFENLDLDVDGVRVHAAISGSGPPVLLLHGYPQSHVMWHRVAPQLAQSHTVVAADLRGYGDSAKPAAGAEHAGYSKRAMARDQVGLMAGLGFDRFAAVGHDRGGRVVHRMCLDHPDAVRAAAVLDIAPTRHMFGTADFAFGMTYYHWFFLAQPVGVPETLIGADPENYLRRQIGSWAATSGPSGPSGPNDGPFDARAMAEYLRVYRIPEALTAMCEDYRAAASIDLVHDDADVAAGNRVTCPLLVLWGSKGFVGRQYDVLAVWREYADDVRGHSVESGHFLPEEAPDETVAALIDFLAVSGAD